MSTSINSFKLFTEYVANKIQQGNSLTIPQFNELANRAQFVVYEKDRQIFLDTQEVSDYLGLFFKNKTTSIGLDGTVPYPDDFQHTASIRAYYVRPDLKSSEITVEPVKNYDWGDISSSQLQAPTKRFPKYSEFRDEFRFLPKDLGTVMIDYFATPVVPVWGYTIVSGRPVYDSTSSTDFSWDEFALNNVASVFLQMVGCNLKDGDLAGFSQMFKQETNSTL